MNELNKWKKTSITFMESQMVIDVIFCDALIIPNTPLTYLLEGIRFLSEYHLIKEEENSSPVALFLKILEINEDYLYEAHIGLGIWYFQMIHEYDKALSEMNEAIKISPELSCAYINRGHIYRKMKKYDLAFADYQKAINIYNGQPEAYYGIGKIYMKDDFFQQAINAFSCAIFYNKREITYHLERGMCYLNIQKYPFALIDFDTARKLQPERYDVYFYLGICKKALSKFYEASCDLNKFLYHWYKDDISVIPNFSLLLEHYWANPYVIRMIWEKNHLKPFSLPFKAFDETLLKSEDVSLLIRFFELDCEKKDVLLTAKAILYYYLENYILSFILFDEEIDTGDNEMSAQEMYYYVLSAQNCDIDFMSILNWSIQDLERRENKEVLDFYYLAHLCLLKRDTQKASYYFTKSSNFIFSNLMLVSLTGEECIQGIEKELTVLCESIMRIKLNQIDSSLSQLQTYFHICECKGGMDSLMNKFDSNFFSDVFTCPFWEIFGMTKYEKEELLNRIEELEAKKILNALIEMFADESNNVTNKNLLVENIEKKIKGKKWKINYIISYMETNIEKGLNIENDLGLAIESWEYNNPEPYVYLLQYYYLRKVISSEEVFTLFLYLMHIAKLQKANELESRMKELSSTFFEWIGIKSYCSFSKNLWSIFNENAFVYEYFPSGEDEKSDYLIFKDNVWKMIDNEKKEMNIEDFKSKYQIYHWFGN